MTISPRHRWTVLAALLSLTLSAAAWVSEEVKKDPEIVDAPPPPARRTTATIAQKDAPVIHLDKLRTRTGASEAKDMFEAHTWRKAAVKTPEVISKPAVVPPPPQQQAIVAPPPQPQAVVAPPPAPPPPMAPPLPFVYLGKLESEEANAVFLTMGDRSLIVHQGDVIETVYHVDLVTETGMTFTHLPTGIQQSLHLGGPK